jgi:serine/threonine protein kinase
MAERSVDRFRIEAQALARLRHANIVEVLDCDVTPDGHPFLVMEHLEGEPLDVQLKRRGGTLPRQEALEVMRQTLGGLHAVHEAGFIHRDIKPANLFRLSDGRVKLLDFGVIKLAETVTSIEPLQKPTADGMVVGTPKYMAPEQATGQRVDRRTDVYAAGVVTYLMLAGRTPFEHHRDLTDMLKAHILEPPTPPSEIAPAGQNISPGLDRAVLKALSKKPRDRYPDALSFAAALQEHDATFVELALELGLDTTVPLGSDEYVQQGELHEPAPPDASFAGRREVTTASPAVAATAVSSTVVMQPAPDLGAATELRPPAPQPLQPPAGFEPLAAQDPSELTSVVPPLPAWRDPVGRVLFVAAAIASALLTAWVAT